MTRITATIVLSVGLAAQAKVWHVSQEPLPGIEPHGQIRTISEAVERLEPGDTAVIHGGVYCERVVVEGNGTSDEPIVLRAAEGEHVVLTGADRLTDWTPVPGDERVYVAPCPHEFIAWAKHNTHPSDEYHRLIGRAEQVFINGYPLHQVLEREQVGRGSFFVDLDADRLYVRPATDEPIAGDKAMVEASVRDRILIVEGEHVRIEGLRFRYAANRAQQGAVEIEGDHVTVEDCTFERTNASGAEFTGENVTVRNCTFAHNGQLGFGANRAHRLHLTGCTVRNNNTKNFNRGWEAGGNKICLTRGAVLEHSTFIENRGNGIWFDIGNEDCVVRNCLIAHNENAGLFYEISYALHAYGNVIVGNGFAFTPGAWGAAAGISISSSPGCTVERNLILGNKEGFNFREQRRTTPRLNGEPEPVWNHDETVRRNVFAWNRDAQVWGWFDVDDERHWPEAMQEASLVSRRSSLAKAGSNDLSLTELNLTFEHNLYCPGPNHGLFRWGVPWKRCERYETLDAVRRKLSLARHSEVREFRVRDFSSLDLRVPADSPALRMHAYPNGPVPGVRLRTSLKQSR